jgi:hypothetical protein
MSNILSEGPSYESSSLDNFCFLAAFLIAFFIALSLKTFLMALSTAFSTPFFLRLFLTVFSTFLWTAFAAAFLFAVFFAIMAFLSTAQVSVPYLGIVGLRIEKSSPAVLQSREFHLFPRRKHPNRHGEHDGSCCPANDPQVQRNSEFIHHLLARRHVHDDGH